VITFEVVLANSTIVHASQDINPGLYWALRGGGSNYGVITKVILEVFPQPTSFYTFQRWNMRALDSVFSRFGQLSIKMPSAIQMLATTLSWSPLLEEFAISERLVATAMPTLPKSMGMRNTKSLQPSSPVLEEYVYTKTTLEMAQKMDRMNGEGFYNYFGSLTVRNQLDIHTKIAYIFFDEVETIKSATGLQIYIVYNPVTVPAMEQMQKRGGNALGLGPSDGPLTSKYSAYSS
jgi:hypothetical protein